MPMRNIFARFRPEATDRDPVRHALGHAPDVGEAEDRRTALPVPGANDGASGVALLIALGDVLKEAPPTVGVDLLFVDGEDYGTFGPPTSTC